jgi:hypothetical protein
LSDAATHQKPFSVLKRKSKNKGNKHKADKQCTRFGILFNIQEQFQKVFFLHICTRYNKNVDKSI